MSSWAVPGAKVVCVDDTKIGKAWKPIFKGAIYTIREASVCMKFGDIGLTLEEIFNDGVDDFNLEIGYRIDRFRPLTKSTKTQEEDIAMFWDIMAEEGEKV